jgi:hypothetical protein
MRVNSALVSANAIVLVVFVFLTVGFEAVGIEMEGVESVLIQQYDLGGERSSDSLQYQMDVEIITRASDGSTANVESYSMRMAGEPVTLSAGETVRWTCNWFKLRLGEVAQVAVPALEGWSYDFNRGVGIDEHGQVLGIPHEKFEGLTDNEGAELDAVVGYQVYNQFIQFHVYVDELATPDLKGGTGIQDLARIGDMIVLDEFIEDLPLAAGLIIKDGSIFRPGVEMLEFKGLSVVDGQPCALLGVDGGEGCFTMVIEVMPNLDAITVGGTRYFGDIYVDLASMWLKKAEIIVVDVTETSMGGNVVANTTIESHYRISAMSE